jgi:hypothetical protein
MKRMLGFLFLAFVMCMSMAFAKEDIVGTNCNCVCDSIAHKEPVEESLMKGLLDEPLGTNKVIETVEKKEVSFAENARDTEILFTDAPINTSAMTTNIVPEEQFQEVVTQYERTPTKYRLWIIGVCVAALVGIAVYWVRTSNKNIENVPDDRDDGKVKEMEQQIADLQRKVQAEKDKPKKVEAEVQEPEEEEEEQSQPHMQTIQLDDAQVKELESHIDEICDGIK